MAFGEVFAGVVDADECAAGSFQCGAGVAVERSDGVGVVFVALDGSAEGVEDDDVGVDEFGEAGDRCAAFGGVGGGEAWEEGVVEAVEVVGVVDADGVEAFGQVVGGHLIIQIEDDFGGDGLAEQGAAGGCADAQPEAEEAFAGAAWGVDGVGSSGGDDGGDDPVFGGVVGVPKVRPVDEL